MPDINSLIQLLQQVKQFHSIPERDLREFILAGQIRDFSSEAIIFSEDSPCAGMYVLLRGQVQLCRHSLEGQVSILSVFDPVILFNEVAALDGGTNPMTAIACQETVLWHISAQKLQEFLLIHPQICFELARILAGRNRRLVAHFQDLSFRSVQSRAAKLLLEMSENGMRGIDRRKAPNHQLAARIATVPEAFSRALKMLREAGAIQVSRQTITVCDRERLALMADLKLF